MNSNTKRKSVVFIIIAIITVGICGCKKENPSSDSSVTKTPDAQPSKSSAPRAKGVDWTQFRGPNRDGICTETGLLTEWPSGGPKMMWSYDKLGHGFASVSVLNGVIYTTGLEGEDGVLYALDTSGNLKWKKTYGKGWTGSNPGTRTTPTIEKDRIYIMSGHGVISCFNTEDGEQKWSIDTFAKFGGENITWGIAESVLIDNEKVICTPGGKDATVVALDKKTGETIWISKGVSDKSAYCSPLVVEMSGKRVVLTMVEKTVLGIDITDGKVLFQTSHPTTYSISAVSPVYDSGVLFVSNGYNQGSVGFTVADDMTVSRKWAQKKLDVHHGSVVLLDGNIHGANTSGQWMCLDLATGDIKYQAKAVGKGSVIFADGMLYCYAEKGLLGLVKPTPDGYDMVSSFKIEMGEKEHWAHPAISHGVLYIRHGEVLMAFDIAMNLK